MARNTQLGQLVEMLREETGRATSQAVGVDDLPQLKNKIRRTQEVLYDEFDWPFMRQVFPVKQLNAHERYYDFPIGLNLERVERVNVLFSGVYWEIQRGISFEDYTFLNSDLGITMDPAQKWDVRSTGSGVSVATQVEIWPVPASSSQKIQFIGKRNLRPLIADSDLADLDDQMIVLTAATELLARRNDASAKPVAAMAAARKYRMQGRVHGATPSYRMGMGNGSQGGQAFKLVVRAR